MKSYKTELDPNNKQRTVLLQHAGAARWAYNWGLRKKINARATGQKTPTAIDLHRELNRLKKTEIPWMYEVSKCAPQEGLRNLDAAFKHFFRRCKQGAKKKGFPRFKSRRRGIGSFTLNGAFRVTDRTIRLPRIGTMRVKERGYLPESERIVSVTVSERAGRWFVSARTDTKPTRIAGKEILGVDVGSRKLAVLSDGTVFENPRALRGAEKRLRVLQKAVSRRVKGSSNRKKACCRLALQHYRVSCVRKDAIHKATDTIAKCAGTVVIESLNVIGMMKNRHLSKSLADASMSEFHRCLKYKMAWAGGQVIEADRFYPSSKTCSRCKAIKEDLGFGEVFRCTYCGFVVDRDLNAAINLKDLAGSSPVTAYCPRSSGLDSGPGETTGWVGTEHHHGLVLDG